MTVNFREALSSDHAAIAFIYQYIVNQTDTYAYGPTQDPQAILHHWFYPNARVFVACDEDNTVLGTYFLRPNQPDRGSHVANAGFMVHPNHTGQGIGRSMGHHCLQTAKQLGYTAMQFNYVVSTNSGAIKLWKSLGFSIVGTLPKAYQHRTQGLVDVYVMYQQLI